MILVPWGRASSVVAGALVAVVTAVSLAACGQVSPEQTATPTPSGDVDLNRLATADLSFPVGFVERPFVLEPTTADPATRVETMIPTAAPLVVSPAQCEVLLEPVEARTGALAGGVAADGLDEQRISVRVADEVVARELPEDGCAQADYREANDGRARGVFEPIAAPAILGATTFGLKITAARSELTEYSLAAVLDSGEFVDVYARLDTGDDAVPMLSGLLEEAVAAVRIPSADHEPSEVPARQESVDIARLAAMRDAFPTGYDVHVGGVEPVPHAAAPTIGQTVAWNEPFAVSPPQCAPLLKPANGKGGSDGIRVDASLGGTEVITLGANDPVSVSGELPANGCERMDVEVGRSTAATGVAERLAAPVIDGATTIALQYRYGEGPERQYFYQAIVDGESDETLVYVRAHGIDDVRARTMLPALLVKAVATVRDPNIEQQPTPPAPPRAPGIDVLQLGEITDELPVDFVPTPLQQKRIGPDDAATYGTVVSYGAPFTVDPSQCRALLQPVTGRVGAVTYGGRADGLNGQSIAVGATDQVVPVALPGGGCDRMTYRVEGRRSDAGTVERIAAPDIDGAETLALRITVDGSPRPEYYFAAILDGHVLVDVRARLTAEAQPDPMLGDLLAKAVTAVRG